MRITVRDDDVILPSSGHSDPFAQFVKVHELIVEYGAIHIPTILCGEIRHFPGAVEYVRQKTIAGEMEPQIHGWGHCQYHKYPRHRVVHHLNLCKDFFMDNWDLQPTKFYTPWGADTPDLQAACADTELELVDCSQIVSPRTVQRSPNIWSGNKDVELFIHWWERLGRLRVALEILRGSHD